MSKRKKSVIRQHFKKINDKNVCNHCNQEFSLKTSSTNLEKHLIDKDGIDLDLKK